MLDILKRIGLIIYQRFFNVDDLAVKYPVCVKGVLIENNKVLLIKNENLNFDLPGGKLDPHQSLEEALIEEFKEETGLKVKVDKLIETQKYFINQRNIIVSTYVVSNLGTNPIKISFENWSYQFVNLSNINDHPVKPWIKILLESNFKD